MALWQFYKELNGETPTKQTIQSLAQQLKLKVSQVYKWFWDMNRKVDNCQGEDIEATPVKGLTPELCAQAFPNLPNLENIEPDEFELLANEVNIDVEKLAQEIIDCPSPTNHRQIVKRVRRVVRADNDQDMIEQQPKESAKEPSLKRQRSSTPRLSREPSARLQNKAITPEPQKKPLIQLPGPAAPTTAFQAVDAQSCSRSIKSVSNSLSRAFPAFGQHPMILRKDADERKSELSIVNLVDAKVTNQNRAFLKDFCDNQSIGRCSLQKGNIFINNNNNNQMSANASPFTPMIQGKLRLTPFLANKQGINFQPLQRKTPMFGETPQLQDKDRIDYYCHNGTGPKLVAQRSSIPSLGANLYEPNFLRNKACNDEEFQKMLGQK